MKGNLSKILSIFIAIIAVIGAFLFIRIYMTDADDIEALNSSVGNIVTFSTILLYFAIGATLILSLIGLFRNPDNLKKTLLGLAVLGVVLVLAYFKADSNAVVDSQGEILKGGEAGGSLNKWVGTGIWYSIALGLVASAFFVYDLVKGLIKS
jgi:magnesium-transporting ATPase (P-type)